MAAITLEFRRQPSALAFMARAFLPSPGLHTEAPQLLARWRHTPSAQRVREFNVLSGLPIDTPVGLLYPHTAGFPLLMALLTHRSFPLPIWRVLQVRNRMEQLAPLAAGAMEFETSVARQRVVDKGVEFDLETELKQDGRAVWRSLNVFYVRGRFGTASAPTTDAVPRFDTAPESTAWRLPRGGGRRFGRLCGDYNGVHLWDAYARRFGFAHAFFHPQRVIGHCLAALPPAEAPLRLDTWLKGPVPYGASVRLAQRSVGACDEFALFLDGETRPALIGRRQPGETLH